MKLAIMHPSVLAGGLDDLEGLARRGVEGLQVQPEMCVAVGGGPRDRRDRMEAAVTGPGLCVPAWCAYRPLIGPESQVAEALEAQKAVINLAARFRALAGPGVRPIVCTETGAPARYPERSHGLLWDQLCESVADLAAHAARRNVCLAIEPTRSHIIDGSISARKLLDQVQFDSLGICFDPANVCGDKDHLGRAIHLLSDVIVLAHAKDVVFGPDGKVASYPPAGKGQLDYAKFIAICSEIERCRYVVLEYLETAQQADEAIAFVRGLLHKA